MRQISAPTSSKDDPVNKKVIYLCKNRLLTMKKLKGQLLRWILIVRKLQNQPYISFRELQRELERELAFRGYDPVCSDATLKRDLNELKEEFGLDITYSRTHKGYSLPAVRKGWLDMDCIIEPIEVMTALGNHSLPEYILPEQYQTRDEGDAVSFLSSSCHPTAPESAFSLSQVCRQYPQRTYAFAIRSQGVARQMVCIRGGRKRKDKDFRTGPHQAAHPSARNIFQKRGFRPCAEV